MTDSDFDPIANRNADERYGQIEQDNDLTPTEVMLATAIQDIIEICTNQWGGDGTLSDVVTLAESTLKQLK